jgi:hypothetical protein
MALEGVGTEMYISEEDGVKCVFVNKTDLCRCVFCNRISLV